MNLEERKTQLRTQMRAMRSSLDAGVRESAQQALASRLLALPAIKHARTIGVYDAISGELSLDPFIEALRASESTCVAYPLVVSETAMAFLRVDAGDDMGAFADPRSVASGYDAGKLVPAQKLDLVLVPGVAFDPKCYRLGQGGGYYDRYLPLLGPECMTVGIAFDEQIVDEVPTDETDRRVDYVVTPTQIYAG